MTVRTRYAPSPTGLPHVGNIRTALFDWLLARHYGGQFVLRIEDTDQARYTPGAVAGLLDSLRWLGIDWDEGPDVGGPYGPYVQSQRLEHYRAAADRLLGQGDAYECWCSPQRLDAVRAAQARNKLPPKYDRRCRSETGRAEARQEAQAEGRGPVVRFKTPLSGEITFHDAIHGETRFDLATLDDFVILKSDGFPTYHLAYIVDDDAMKITHVLRGDEWIPSAPRHMLIYRALGIEPPVLAHLPRVLGADRAKLSKRHGATSVLEYRDRGYLPEALFNFLGLLGWSLDDHTVIISREQFIENFTLERVVKNPAIFDLEKLTWMNGVYIREMPEERLAALLLEQLDRDLPAQAPRPLDAAVVRRIVPLVRERIKLLTEVAPLTEFFFIDELAYASDDLLGKGFRGRPEVALAALRTALARLESVRDWRHEDLEASMRALAEELGVKAGDLFMPIRVAVTGRAVSPPLFETMEVLGRERTLTRLSAALEQLRQRTSASTGA